MHCCFMQIKWIECEGNMKYVIDSFVIMADLFFSCSRSQRLQFDVSSPNGILLFRETSKMITTYGTWIQIFLLTLILICCLVCMETHTKYK